MLGTAQAKKHVYRVGDVVTVVDPQVVTRVGYPLFLGDVITEVEQKHDQLIHRFMAEAGYGAGDLDSCDYRFYLDIVKAIAGAHMRSVHFGGAQRSIHTEVNEKLRNTKGWTVTSRRIVKTGIYNRGGYSHGFDGEGDYEPPHLANEKSHVLLSLMNENGHVSDWNQIEIEAARVVIEKAQLTASASAQ